MARQHRANMYNLAYHLSGAATLAPSSRAAVAQHHRIIMTAMAKTSGVNIVYRHKRDNACEASVAIYDVA